MAEPLLCPKCRAALEPHEVASGVVAHACPACFGVLYAAADIAVPLKIAGATPARFDCPRCRRPMATGKAYDGQIELDQCEPCAVLWFDAGEIQILRKLSGVEGVAGKPSAEEPQRVALPPMPRLERTRDEPGKVEPPEMSGARNPDADRAPQIELGGRLYRHFQTSVPVTTAVLGEFPWIAKVGDTARMRDFICPPYLLSEELTATEAVWTEGEYVEPEEVWSAFMLPGAPPAKSGVAPAQPNPWDAQMPTLWATFALAAAVCVGTYAVFSAGSTRGVVYEGSFTVGASDAERSRVGETFEVKGRPSNLQVSVDTNLDGRWAYVSMALIEADTDRAFDFGREMSYYHGYEDGESWSEGSGQSTLYVPSVPAGRYYLRIEPETDSPQLNLRVVVRRDVPLKRVPFIAILLLLAPVVFAGLRGTVFENARWMESDHPRTSEEDDE